MGRLFERNIKNICHLISTTVVFSTTPQIQITQNCSFIFLCFPHTELNLLKSAADSIFSIFRQAAWPPGGTFVFNKNKQAHRTWNWNCKLCKFSMESFISTTNLSATFQPPIRKNNEEVLRPTPAHLSGIMVSTTSSDSLLFWYWKSETSGGIQNIFLFHCSREGYEVNISRHQNKCSQSLQLRQETPKLTPT